jgi:hypothetical protein
MPIASVIDSNLDHSQRAYIRKINAPRPTPKARLTTPKTARQKALLLGFRRSLVIGIIQLLGSFSESSIG